ncbi:unnamed protein product [Meganyctiphanes norvegica]|uniref:Uncharacterized protein n=1 Tax=Meganyctiphanes norvegica TaxID=48144 RepID=A0AAV2RSW0_MEGNR
MQQLEDQQLLLGVWIVLQCHLMVMSGHQYLRLPGLDQHHKLLFTVQEVQFIVQAVQFIVLVVKYIIQVIFTLLVVIYIALAVLHQCWSKRKASFVYELRLTASLIV